MATRPEVSFQNAKKKETQSGTIMKFKEMLTANPEDLGTSGSHWSKHMFSKYKEAGCIQIKSDLKISPSGNSIPDDLWKGVEKEYRTRAKCVGPTDEIPDFLSKLKVEPKVAYVSLRLRVQNAVPAQPCVGKIRISLVLLNFLHCNFRLWFETP